MVIKMTSGLKCGQLGCLCTIVMIFQSLVIILSHLFTLKGHTFVAMSVMNKCAKFHGDIQAVTDLTLSEPRGGGTFPQISQ